MIQMERSIVLQYRLKYIPTKEITLSPFTVYHKLPLKLLLMPAVFLKKLGQIIINFAKMCNNSHHVLHYLQGR